MCPAAPWAKAQASAASVPPVDRRERLTSASLHGKAEPPHRPRVERAAAHGGEVGGVVDQREVLPRGPRRRLR